MPELRQKVNEHVSSPSSISNEAHVVGEDTTDKVFLDEKPDPEVAIVVTGVAHATYTQVSAAPATGEFQLIEGTSELRFHSSDADDPIEVDYTAWGSQVYARDFNRFYDRLVGIQTLTDAADIQWDLSLKATAYVGLTASRNMDEPTGMEEGMAVLLMVGQTGAGSWTLTWDAVFDFGDDGEPTLSTAAGTFDILGFVVRSGAMVFTGFKTGFTI